MAGRGTGVCVNKEAKKLSRTDARKFDGICESEQAVVRHNAPVTEVSECKE